eukprot:12719104-Alexandrium_andersonii.AAC.1
MSAKGSRTRGQPVGHAGDRARAAARASGLSASHRARTRAYKLASISGVTGAGPRASRTACAGG